MSGSTIPNAKTIEIIKGREYQAREEEVYKGNIFFAESYAAARDCVYDIIDASRMVKKQLLNDAEAENWQELIQLAPGKINHFLRGRVNNIVAFCADRGQGKTSAMRSFAQELREYAHQRREPGGQVEPKERRDFWAAPAGQELPQMRFVECIDPTMMSEQDSIIKVILSRMFMRASQKEEKEGPGQGRRSDSGKRDELLRQFQRCFHDAEILRGEDRDQDWLEEDDLEKMAELGDSSNLLASMYRLILLYLDYMGSDQDCLVIQIDDADMQISKTYQILEDIRRYLLLPDLIILFAANMTQLESTIEQHFLKEYEISLNISDSMGTMEYCHNIAALYLEKALPVPHRIFLPRLEEHWRELFLVYREPRTEDEPADSVPKNLLSPPGGRDWRIEKQLLSYLHRKTGMVFLGSGEDYHDFLPTNLRDLTHFLAYFEKLEELRGCYDAVLNIFSPPRNAKSSVGKRAWKTISAWEKNLNLFQDYLVRLWPGTSLREPSRRLFMGFAEEALFNKHEYLLRNLPDYYSRERRLAGELQGITVKDEESYRREYLRQCRLRGVVIPEAGNGGGHGAVSGSYADVMTGLSVLGELFGSSRQGKLICAVRLYYSVCFHQMLLRRLRHLDRQPAPDENLTYFMRDAFIKDIRKNRRYRDFMFWRVEIPSDVNFPDPLPMDDRDDEKMYWGLEESDLDDWIDFHGLSGISNLFLRRQLTDGATVWTCPAEKELRWHDIHSEKHIPNGLVFHPFYRLMRELDIFTYTDKTDPPYKDKTDPQNEIILNDSGRLRMLLAFSVFLNWDVQHHLLSISQSSEGLQVTDWTKLLRSVYWNEEMVNLLIGINELNSDLNWGVTKITDRIPNFLETFFSEHDDIDKFAAILDRVISRIRASQQMGSSKSGEADVDLLSPELSMVREFVASMVHAVYQEISGDRGQKS